MASILVIDDDPLLRRLLFRLIKEIGYECVCAESLADGLKQIENGSFDVVFLDVALPDGSGLDLLPHIKNTESSPEVIIITGYADSDGAELAIKHGAWDYIEKGAGIETIKLPLLRAVQHRKELMRQRTTLALDREEIIGNSPLMKQCFNQLAKAATSDANVLITGESGTGKELLALALHSNSPRSNGDFVTVDCASLPETLVESLLFGHEKGAFTGAEQKRDGLIAQANGGTLFLDEIGELSLDLQKSFLRVLQERRFRPIGSKKEFSSDFRLVSATNKNLNDLIDRGAFRNDLFYRLQAFHIHLPPLRDRKKDIRDISIQHLANLSEKSGLGPKSLSTEFFDALMAYDWPGNVRELKHALDEAFYSSTTEPVLYSQHLPDQVRIEITKRKLSTNQHKEHVSLSQPSEHDEFHSYAEYKNAMELRYFRSLMMACDGDISKACHLSGVSRSGIYHILKKHRLLESET